MVFAVLLIFSVASAKRDDYILPAIPPLAIIIATLFSPALSGPSMKFARSMRDISTGVIALAAGLSTIAIVILIAAGQHIGLDRLKLESADATFVTIFVSGVTRREPPFLFLLASGVIGAVFCLQSLWRRDDSRAGIGLAIVALALTLLWTGLLKPREAATRSVRLFAHEVHDRIGNAHVYIPWQDPEFTYYYGIGVPALPRTVARNGPPPSTTFYFVARPNQLFVLAPAVRDRLIPILRSDVAGGGGPPVLYQMSPPPK
jgi:4-amino-4-deoxy-L-arabinose transferase-like glycosyltransferase